MKTLFLVLLAVGSISSYAEIYLNTGNSDTVSTCSGIIRSVTINQGGIIDETRSVSRDVFVSMKPVDDLAMKCKGILYIREDFNIGVSMSTLVGRKMECTKSLNTKDGSGISCIILN